MTKYIEATLRFFAIIGIGIALHYLGVVKDLNAYAAGAALFTALMAAAS